MHFFVSSITVAGRKLFDDEKIFFNIFPAAQHVLSSYSQRSDSLRARGQDCVLPVRSSNLHKQSFIVINIFDFIQLVTSA